MGKEEINAAEQEAEKIRLQATKDAEIKAKYKAVHKIVTLDEAGAEKVAYFREPSRLAVGVHLAKYDQNPVEACEIIFNDAVIREVSDVEYFQRSDVQYGMVFKIQALIAVKKSTLMTL